MVFQCDKCKRYLYCKETQKEKKCPMCHHINHILEERFRYEENGALFGKTLTEAANEVIKRQNLYSMSKTTDFKSIKTPLTLHSNSNRPTRMLNDTQLKNNPELPLNRIIKSILNWQLQENIDPEVGFPKYMLNMILGQIGYTKVEIYNILNQIRKTGCLVSKKNDYYYLISNSEV